MNKKDKIISTNKLNILMDDDSNLPKKSLFRIDEVADYFNVGRSTIYLWISHGILTAEKYNGGIMRISREAILNCRFNNQLKPLE